MIQPRLVWELARKDLLLFLADRRGVLLCFGVPILLASVFGAIFHRPDEALPVRPTVSVVAGGGGRMTQRIVRALCASEQLQASACDLASARRRLAAEPASFVVVLPGNFEVASSSKGVPPCVQILHPPGNGLESRLVEGVLTEIVFCEAARDWLGPLAKIERPFTVERLAVNAAGALSINAYSHSFCGMTVQYLLFWGVDSGLLLLRERRNGVWQRLRAAPLTGATLLCGKALATALVALAQLLAVFAFGALVFGVRITGSPLGFVLMALSAALLSAATGLLVAALGGNEARARSVAILVILTLSLLGGLWVPAFLLPAWARQAALALPTTWAARGLEGVTWQGMDLAGAAPCALALLGFSMAFLLVAWRRLARMDAPALWTGAVSVRRPPSPGVATPGLLQHRPPPVARTIALVVGIFVATAPMAPAQQAAVPVIAMPDQFSRAHDVRDHRGNVVVLIYGDRQSADANKALGALLHVAFHPGAKGLPPAQARKAPVQDLPGIPPGSKSPDVFAVPVACVGDVPALVRALIRGQVRAASPDVPVWMDFADTMKKQFGLKPGVPNVVILDALGRCRFTGDGVPTAQDAQRLVDLIQGLRRAAAAKKD